MPDAPECPDTARADRWATAGAYVVVLGACFLPVVMAAAAGVVLWLAGVR